MANCNYFKSGTSVLLASFLSAAGILSIVPLNPASAQVYDRNERPNRSQRDFYQRAAIPTGARIPVDFNKEKILAAPDESFPVTLTVAADIRDRNRDLLIPFGSKIEGRIEPDRDGSRFIANKLIIDGAREYQIDAISQTVTRRETIKQGAGVQEILSGAAAGAGAASIISAVTGRRGVAALEVLAGAAAGALAGWALPEAGIVGGGRREVIVIYPDRDLDLTFERDLFLDR